MNFVTTNFANSMNTILTKRRALIKCYEIDLHEFVELTNREKVFGYFSFNDKPIVKKLKEVGVKFEPISDKIVLNSSREDTLYVVNAVGYSLKDENDNIPSYISIEIKVYQTYDDKEDFHD